MKARFVLAVLVSWLVSPSAFSDLVPENHDFVDHEILFEGMDRFPKLTFVLYPTQYSAPNEWTELRPGISPTWFKHASPQVYAYPREGEAPADRSFFDRPEVLVSDLVVFRSNWVPKDSGIAHKRTIYRISGIDGKEIIIEPGPQEQFDASGKLLQAVPAPALHRRKPKPGAPAMVPVPFEISPGRFWAIAGVSCLGLFVLFKLRKSAAARDAVKP